MNENKMNLNNYSSYYENNYYSMPYNNDNYYLHSLYAEHNMYNTENLNYYQYHQQYYQYNNSYNYLPVKENVMISNKIGNFGKFLI
jgi:hypothetical protein